jgi:lysozyme
MDWHSLFWADELFAPQGKLATIWFDKLVLQNTGEDSLEGAINILRETEQFSDATAETLKTIWVPVQTLIPNWAAGNSELLRSSPEDIRETVTTALKKRIRKEYGADFAETYPGIREVAWGSLLYLEAIQIWSTLNKSAPTTIVFNSTNYDNQVNQVGSTVIYSNRSSAALFGHSFTIDTWHEYFAGKGLPVLYFNLLPRVFVPVLASISAAAAWVPPGLNVVTDIYAGDARQPDFSAIRSAGIQAFIHKATDPIYAFNAQLYNARRAQALAAGLLWGSYHFGRSGDGAQQADNYLDAINPQDNEFVCLDFEKDQNRPDTVMSLSEAAVFIGRVQQRLGQPPFLYGGAYLRESLQGATANPLSACKLWFADYRQRPGPQIPALWNSWTLWQFAGDIPAGQPGSLPTLDNTDRSVFNGTNQQLKATWRCRPQPAG